MLQLSMAEGNTSATHNKEEKMEELKTKMQLIAYDLSLAMEEWEKGDADYMDNTCCRVQSLIHKLQELYPQLCEKADDVRNGRA